MAYYHAPGGYPHTNHTPCHINNPGGDPYADVPPYQGNYPGGNPDADAPPYQGNYPGADPYADAPPHQGSFHPDRKDEHPIQKSQTETHSSTLASVTVERKSKLAEICKRMGRQITLWNMMRFLFIVFFLGCASVIIWVVVMGVNHSL